MANSIGSFDSEHSGDYFSSYEKQELREHFKPERGSFLKQFEYISVVSPFLFFPHLPSTKLGQREDESHCASRKQRPDSHN